MEGGIICREQVLSPPPPRITKQIRKNRTVTVQSWADGDSFYSFFGAAAGFAKFRSCDRGHNRRIPGPAKSSSTALLANGLAKPVLLIITQASQADEDVIVDLGSGISFLVDNF